MKAFKSKKIVFIIGIFVLISSIVISTFILFLSQSKNTPVSSHDKRAHIYAYQRLRESFAKDVPGFYYYTKDIDGNGMTELLILENTTLHIYTYVNRNVQQIGSHDFVTGTFKFFESDKYDGIFVFAQGGSCDHYNYLTIINGNISITPICKYDYSGEDALEGAMWVDMSDDKEMIAEAKELYNQNKNIDFWKYGPVDIEEHFEKILNNEQSFYSTNKETDILLSDYNLEACQYSVVDMDNDNIDELAISLYGGNTLILRIDGESVIGFEFGMRAMSQIFTDGSFLWNANNGNTQGCSRLEFTGKTYNTIELHRIETNESGSTSFYIDGKIATIGELRSLYYGKDLQYINWIPFSTAP